jgi:hypothetical protein
MKINGHFGELAVDERTSVEITEDVTMWAGFIWLRTGTGGEPL